MTLVRVTGGWPAYIEAQASGQPADDICMTAIGSNFSALNISAALATGAATVSAGSQQLNRDAQQIANPDGPDSTNALLDLNQSSLIAQAGADVIRTSDQMLGTLLDAFA